MGEVELTVLMPCLNEEKTIGTCIEKALKTLRENRISGEVLISDNGSTDRSVEIARSLGARVVFQPKKGYGNAYLKGLSEAKGKYILMGDSDDTYDFGLAPEFLKYLRQGYDFVIGSRLKGRIMPGAMPGLHRFIGNPSLSFILNTLFGTRVSDCHCGIRALSKEAAQKMELRSSGMEFASEMIIKAGKKKLKTKEFPITYYSRPKGSQPNLRSFHDGWRHLRFMLLYSPTYLFLIPGLALFLAGMLLEIALLQGPLIIDGFSLDIHPMILGSLLAIAGFQVMGLGMYSKVFAVTNKLDTPSLTTKFISKHISLERGILVGAMLLGIGLVFALNIVFTWLANGAAELSEVRTGLFALTLSVIGIQTIFSAFFLSLMAMPRD